MAENPWKLDTPREQERYMLIQDIILREYGHAESLIEFGCGEGYQTQYLREICTKIYGIDISKIAIKRARKYYPGISFTVGNTTDYFGHFSIATAFEVLYYAPDKVQMAIDNLTKSADFRIISYWSKRDFLDAFFTGERFHTEIIKAGGLEWKVVWW